MKNMNNNHSMKIQNGLLKNLPKKWMHYIIALILSLGICEHALAMSADQRMAEEILVYINQFRVQHGLPKLKMDPVLVKVAMSHSRDMATHALPFGHDKFNQRMNYAHQHIADSLSGAENVAYNYKTAKIVVDGWVHSPGHRRNIMGHYNLTGVAIARDDKGRPYFTQMFLRQDARLAKDQVVVAHAKKKWRRAFKGFVG